MKSTTGNGGEDLGSLPIASRPIWSLTRWPLFLLLTIGGMALTVLSVSHAQVQAVEALAENTELSADKDSGEVDYWADVTFGKFHFREVLEQVRNHYIDKDYDKIIAYESAANQALSVLRKRWELVPESYYKRMKKRPDEKKRWSGKLIRVEKGAKYVILEHIEGWNDKERKEMTDDEIRQKRLDFKERYRELKGYWKKTKFGKADFEKVVAYAIKNRGSDVTTNRIWISAAQGYLGALDPHSTLISDKAWKESNEELRDASFEGIGALLTQRNDEIIVESPMEGQPAEKSGLRAGDVIIKVNGEDIRGLFLRKVVTKIKGPKGTDVVLTVQRVGVPDDLEIKITRAFIKITNVSGRLLGPEHADIGYVKVRGFIENTTSELRQAITALKGQSASGELRGLVLDMRNNAGGFLHEAYLMSDLFLELGRIVTVKSRTRIPEEYDARKGRDITLPMVVLVDDGTASAAEIVASAVQENKRALVFGDRTFGKATVQQLIPPNLGDGYWLKLTHARYYGPMGNTLQVVGVFPDVNVTPDVAGTMPLGFREENLYDHLPRIESKKAQPNEVLVRELGACVKENGRAEAIHAADMNRRIKFDFQLYKAADYLQCLLERNVAMKKN